MHTKLSALQVLQETPVTEVSLNGGEVFKENCFPNYLATRNITQ